MAVLLVVGYHAGMPLPGGFVGVDIFFVISGFVITGMLLREWERDGRIRFGRFYLRRIKRLTPALALMVAVTVLLSALFLSPLGPQQTTAQTAVGAMFIVANAVIARNTGDYFDGPAESNALLHTWSLSVEEQFYLVFPVLLALSWMLSRRLGLSARRLSSVVVGLVAAFSLAVAVAVSRGLELQAGEMLVGFYGPLTRVWEFAVGALIALVPQLSRGRGGGVVQGIAGVLLLVAAVVLISGDTPFPGVWTLLPVTGTALLIVAGAQDDHAISRFLRTGPMVKIGDWSYSIYLWHWPFVVFAGAFWTDQPWAVVFAALLSILPAVASYNWVEEPIRNMELGGAGFRSLLAASIAPPVTLAIILFIAVDRGFWSSTVKAHQAAVLEPHAGCYGYVPLTDATSAGCTTNRLANGDPIYLVGDSHAMHFTEAVETAGEKLGRPVLVATATNCPVAVVELRFDTETPTHNTDCERFRKGTMAFLGDATPGAVVLASSDRYWTDDRFAAGEAVSTLTTRSDAKFRVATQALQLTVRRLQESGHDVLLVKDVPRWDESDAWSPHDCTVLSLASGKGSCEQRMAVSSAEERQGGTRAVLDEVALRTNATLLDPWASLCPGGWCTTHRAGQLRYRDTNHITVGQSAALSPVFELALATAGPNSRDDAARP